MSIQSSPFSSGNLNDFIVLEERRGNVSLYPHTEQLPKIYAALDKEFRVPLPQLVLRLNGYSNEYWKILRKHLGWRFCQLHNSGRADKLRLFCLLDQNKIAQNTIVQQITLHSPLGPSHRFRFYGEKGFFPDIRLCGKEVVFSDHVLQRFGQRVHNNESEELSAFFYKFYREPMIGMQINGSRALVLTDQDPLLAFTYKETETEYFLTTCLTPDLVNDVKVIVPVPAFNLHYGDSFVRPLVRNWIPIVAMFRYERDWLQKKAVPPNQVFPPETWEEMADGLNIVLPR